jgi:hypothetical protein
MHQFHDVENVDTELRGHQVGSGAGGAAGAPDSELLGQKVGPGAGSATAALAAGVAETAPPPAGRSLQLRLRLRLRPPAQPQGKGTEG